mgnify:CR=1 FL=1
MIYKIILISMFSLIMGEDFYNPDGKPFTLSITTNVWTEYSPVGYNWIEGDSDSDANSLSGWVGGHVHLGMKLPVSKVITISYYLKRNLENTNIRYDNLSITAHIPLYKIWE